MKLTGPTDKARGLLRTLPVAGRPGDLCGVGAAFAAAAAAPLTYTATAEVGGLAHPDGSNPLAPDMGTERAIAQSGWSCATQHRSGDRPGDGTGGLCP